MSIRGAVVVSLPYRLLFGRRGRLCEAGTSQKAVERRS
jgi:hypothetical protein